MSVRSFKQNEASSEDRPFPEAPKGYKVWRVDAAWSSTKDGRLAQEADAAQTSEEAPPAEAQLRR